MIQKHVRYTGSPYAAKILEEFDANLPRFKKVLPKDYERMLSAIREVEARGLTGDEALMEAFSVNNSDVRRVSGN